jgi:integrase
MAFADVPAFLTCLHTRQSVAALALEFAVLTVARTNEVLGAKWGEIDAENSVWTVPACRMKAGARIASRYSGACQGQGRGFHLSWSATGPTSFKPRNDHGSHEGQRDGSGFRSSFSDWASETTNFPREVIEQCLAHLVGSNVVRSYRRGDILEKRRIVQ